MKLNIGSGKKKIDGYLNLDALDWEGVTDIVQNVTDIPWIYGSDIFPDNSVDEILMVEFLEHIAFRECQTVLNESFRVLKDGGLLHVQVPDIGGMCEMYAKKEICSCVPRKAVKYEEYKADANCLSCGGRAKIHPERFWFAFSGAQKHPFDSHLNHFDGDRLARMFAKTGFQKIERSPNIYKVIIKGWK